MTVTADQVRATKWVTLQQLEFGAGGYGKRWQSFEFPELVLKIYRPTRRDPERRALYIGTRLLDLFYQRAQGDDFASEIYEIAADLLSASRPAEASA